MLICGIVAGIAGRCAATGQHAANRHGGKCALLIPGIPLINAMLDILDGHVLMGVSRLIQASTLIICIALGLATTMLLMGVDSL